MKTTDQLKAANQTIRDFLASGVEDRLRAMPGVTHVSVGLKETDGRATSDLCVRVYVAEKRTASDLPSSALIPARIDGVATDVNTIGDVEFQADANRYRPLIGGIQITNRIIGAIAAGRPDDMVRGTLGCVAIDGTDKAPVLLTSWHVLFAHGGRAGDKVFQPAPIGVDIVPAASLPLRPRDEIDKIAFIRRGVVNDKVDCAIAALDVSSCCRCCGLRYSNEIFGLRDAGQPPRTTIVGDDHAVAGMPVFKVGHRTMRSAGVVVDPNCAPFTITLNGTPHTFAGQMAIESTTPAEPFSDQGDSGAAIISKDNKIVGLLFARGKKITAGGSVRPFVTFANHIGNVLSALNVTIPFSSEIKVTSGEVLEDVPVFEAPVPEPYRALRARLDAHPATARLLAIGEQHREEIVHLVNHCRPVTVAWHRCHGPALLATLMGSVRDGTYQIPPAVKGVTLPEALARMRSVLGEHGSDHLRESLALPEGDRVIRSCEESADLRVVLECLRGAASCEGAVS
jgi:hypothetical protein